MIFTTKAEYGVRLLIELGRQQAADPAHPVALKSIAEGRGSAARVPGADRRPPEEAGPGGVHRGAHGGYRLARPASEISMDEAILARGVHRPDGLLLRRRRGPRHVLAPERSREACGTKVLWTRVQGAVHGALQRTTLAELVDFKVRVPAPEPISGAAA